MSINLEGKKCAFCNAYLFDNDDVVFCPVCGAPHHRDCYNKLGHCAKEELHGTENEYDSSKETNGQNENTVNTEQQEAIRVDVKCPMCGEVYDGKEQICPNCKTPNTFKMGKRFIGFDFLGGVPADLDLGDGVTANEAKRFVMANTNRYIPKFALMATGKKASFNLLAFLFPAAWFLSRKMYKIGLIVATLFISLTMVSLPFLKSVMGILPDETIGNYQLMSEYLTNHFDKINITLLVFFIVSGLLLLAIMLISGILGDYIYRNHVIKTVKSIKQDSEDIAEDMAKKGGVNILLFLLGFLAVDYLPQILASLAGL